MSAENSAKSAVYSQYRKHVEGAPLIGALRSAVIVLFVINTGFVLVDWLVYPEKLAEFLRIRVALDLTLGLIFVWGSRRHPVASSFATVFAGGAMLFAVVMGTGGANSDYYVGLILLFIGIGVLAPLSARQAATAIGSLFGVYVTLPFMIGTTSPWQTSPLSLFFLTAAAFEGVMSCAVLDRFRFADYSQRRELEEARDQLKELDREKSRFTANVHHELRTPLTLTLAPLEAMLDGEFGEVSEVQRGYLTTMRSNSRRLLKLINNLLDLAKIEGKRMQVFRRPTRVQLLVDELLSGARPLAERKGIELDGRTIESLPPINVDPEALEKVVLNLVGNALKFTEAGGRIEVLGHALDDGGIHLIVSDTGVGLAEDQLDRIFDRFAQVDSSNTKRHEGTGIGLALVHELISLHGGRIWAESEGLGHGTQVHFILPLGEVDVEVDEATIESASTSSGFEDSLAVIEGELAELHANNDDVQLAEMHRSVDRAESAREGIEFDPSLEGTGSASAEVLIVDDNADMRRLLADLIGKRYRIRLARNGAEALERTRERIPDLILTDVMMPVMSGTELCSAIKSNPKFDRIPVMLLTSKAEREMKIKGLELGADDYVTKPFHPRELMARVDSLVRVRILQDELSIRNALLESTNEELKSTLIELREAGSQLVQAERLAAVGELAAGIAHEVNNPVNFALNAIRTLQSEIGNVEGVLRKLYAIDWSDPSRLEARVAELHKIQDSLDFDEAAETLGELLAIATEGLERTTRLVGDLRDFASPSDGVRMDMDVRRGLESTLQLVNHNIRDASIEVVTRFDDDLPLIPGDAGSINQVFLNLLKNATEAMVNMGGTICVTARQEEASILVEIHDDGPGIAAEDLPEIFEPFYSTKSAGSGTGLGLSMSRRIVTEHGGTIEAVSTPGSGTTFAIRLPIRGNLDSTEA
jgi:signal transduction histidine kinase